MPPVSTPILSTEELSFSVGGFDILTDISLEVRNGEFLAVIGPNGAGKTTLFNLLSGLLQPTAGRIRLAGKDITGRSVPQRARAGLVRSFQVTSVFPTLTVVENVRLAAQAHAGGSFNLWQRVRPGDPAVAAAGRALGRVGLAGLADRPAAALSHGNKRKLELALGLAAQPKVLLLDEPTAGMSVEDLPDLIRTVKEIQEAGTTVVMVEHRMDVIVDLADRIAVMHHGSLLVCDTPEAVMADETVQSAYLGAPL